MVSQSVPSGTDQHPRASRSQPTDHGITEASLTYEQPAHPPHGIAERPDGPDLHPCAKRIPTQTDGIVEASRQLTPSSILPHEQPALHSQQVVAERTDIVRKRACPSLSEVLAGFVRRRAYPSSSEEHLDIVRRKGEVPILPPPNTATMQEYTTRM